MYEHNKDIHLFLYSTDMISLKSKMKELMIVYPQLKVTYIEERTNRTMVEYI